jgi:hypothetical protein
MFTVTYFDDTPIIHRFGLTWIAHSPELARRFKLQT